VIDLLIRGESVFVTEDPEIRDQLAAGGLPTASVVDATGAVVMRRSGRAVIRDAAALAAAASGS
jgi:hypothetical protein